MNTIHIADPSDEEMYDMLDFCYDNKLSLTLYECIDVSDVSGRYDTIATFKFDDDADAVLFKLRWYK